MPLRSAPTLAAATQPLSADTVATKPRLASAAEPLAAASCRDDRLAKTAAAAHRDRRQEKGRLRELQGRQACRKTGWQAAAKCGRHVASTAQLARCGNPALFEPCHSNCAAQTRALTGVLGAVGVGQLVSRRLKLAHPAAAAESTESGHGWCQSAVCTCRALRWDSVQGGPCRQWRAAKVSRHMQRQRPTVGHQPANLQHR